MSITPERLLGKTILVGITMLDNAGNVIEQIQIHGIVAVATAQRFEIRLPSGQLRTLPPDYSNVFAAPPGSYRLRATGEVIVNPDFTATWDVHAPG